MTNEYDQAMYFRGVNMGGYTQGARPGGSYTGDGPYWHLNTQWDVLPQNNWSFGFTHQNPGAVSQYVPPSILTIYPRTNTTSLRPYNSAGGNSSQVNTYHCGSQGYAGVTAGTQIWFQGGVDIWDPTVTWLAADSGTPSTITTDAW